MSDALRNVEGPIEVVLGGARLTLTKFAGLRADVEARLAANDKLIVSLKAQRGASYRMFVDVLDELKLAGATRISIANPEH